MSDEGLLSVTINKHNKIVVNLKRRRHQIVDCDTIVDCVMVKPLTEGLTVEEDGK